MKIALLVTMTAAALIARSSATTIGFTGTPSASVNKLTDPLGTPLPNGYLVRVGTFAAPQNLSITMDFATMAAQGGWTEFGTTVTKSIASFSGKLLGQLPTLIDSYASTFDNDPVYIWAFNAPTAGAATATGIFTAPGGTTPWTFPHNNGGAPGDTITLNTDNATLQAISGVGSTNGTQLRLSELSPVAPVPEPSTALFGTVVVMAELCRRRRRSQPRV